MMWEWWQRLKDSGAVWEFPNDMRAPHVVLRSGKHSDGFIDTLQYLSLIPNLRAASVALARALRSKTRGVPIDWVFGSPMAGIPIAVAAGFVLNAQYVAFTEKTGKDKELVCRFNVPEGENVLLIEEMTTTGGTPQRGIDAILARNPGANVVPFVGAFLTHNGNTPPGLLDAELVSVVDTQELGISYNEWEPAECPLCAGGSIPVTQVKRVWRDLVQTMKDPSHPVPMA
ncbi:MAG: hypothetical protein A2653_02725 [Candidatus Zambryskibacteria bacterium RIFCSPHIGHO2_01_FULL_43_25]|nr:MAG: hypothetical protein A2653_02725 [Candidatus Zambryskibacteria bacterium RIFCSPHIGHO2_01_FULL_43_25]OHB00536.1 MAG: hypothetical protein A3E94_01935 [Candidatus Zambryskibacteria bacterium RIFCSPHIGHO2_12_FULL_44_12b]